MVNIQKYQEKVTKGFNYLNNQKDIIFLGQNTLTFGCPMHNAMKEVNRDLIIETPIFEDTQIGMCIGLNLEGFIPVCIFPRMDFLICAINQLVNHLDKVEKMSQEEFKTGIILISQLGNSKPLNPGPQHNGNYITGLRNMLKNTRVFYSSKPDVDLIYAHMMAKKGKSTLIIFKPTGAWK